MHKWAEKALRMMRDAQAGNKTRKQLEPKNPEQEAEAATYRLPDGRPGMPATAFKAAIADAARLFPGVTIVQTKASLFVQGEGMEQLIAIQGDSYIREDTPRVGQGTADLRYRRCFEEWSARLRVTFVPSVVNIESVIALVDAAGMGGVGDWRPSSPKSKSGTYGRFRFDENATLTQVR